GAPRARNDMLEIPSVVSDVLIAVYKYLAGTPVLFPLSANSVIIGLPYYESTGIPRSDCGKALGV
ncbi:MAG TPA: hypothetical protein VJ646_07910, partial [Candidatus Binatia bacterium]|nr:hypothetical protein [Candidatus Binatia bacterium]